MQAILDYIWHELVSQIGTDDLFDIYSEFLPVVDQWKSIGLALRLPPTVLNTIDTKHDVNTCLLEVLTQWLKQTYNVEQFGKPSWKLLVKALSDPAGGNDCALAQKIAQKHQGITWFTWTDTCSHQTYFVHEIVVPILIIPAQLRYWREHVLHSGGLCMTSRLR